MWKYTAVNGQPGRQGFTAFDFAEKSAESQDGYLLHKAG